MWEKVGDRTFSGSPWDSRQPSLQERGGGSGDWAFWQRAADQRKNQPRTSASSLMYLATLPWVKLQDPATFYHRPSSLLHCTDMLLLFLLQDVAHLCEKAQNLATWPEREVVGGFRSCDRWFFYSLSILGRRSSSISFGTLGLVVQMKRRSLPVGRISLSKPAEQPPLSIVRTTFDPYFTLKQRFHQDGGDHLQLKCLCQWGKNGGVLKLPAQKWRTADQSINVYSSTTTQRTFQATKAFNRATVLIHAK